MPANLGKIMLSQTEEVIDVYNAVYERMIRIHRRARMSPQDQVALDVKVLDTAGTLAASLITTYTRAGTASIAGSSEDGLDPALSKNADTITTLHAHIYSQMLKLYSWSRITPEDEVLLDGRLFEAAANLATTLFERNHS